MKKNQKIVCVHDDPEFNAGAINREDLNDPIKLRKKVRANYGGWEAHQEAANNLRRQFIDELHEAYQKGDVVLPRMFAERLKGMPLSNWLAERLPSGRNPTYTPEDKAAYVKKVDELYEAGCKPKEKAMEQAGEELWPSNKHKRPNSSQYYPWKKIT